MSKLNSNVNAFGQNAVFQNKGYYVDAFGDNAAVYNEGSNVVAIGSAAGYENTGNNCIFLGSNPSITTSNTLSDKFIVYSTTATPFLYGDVSTGLLIIRDELNVPIVTSDTSLKLVTGGANAEWNSSNNCWTCCCYSIVSQCQHKRHYL
jgi:hypothetical protein